MATTDDPEVNELAELAPEQLSDELARDIARRWDPERLLTLVAARAGKGEALDASLRARYEQKLGVDLGHVRVYTGQFAEEFNKQRNADAVTIGGTGMILMGGTTDRPMESAAGQALLAHELTHVAQAERGVHRAGRGVDMELATEEHEAEAEEAEQQELAAQRGGAGAGDGGERAKKKGEELEAEVMEKVIAMLGEAMRGLVERSGLTLRRP
ncbi:MAG: DUF4157 domain-containing protein [Kofleriaceae bacterium]|nr:DUF4157 domain-containing protein [Kofleriaceae bacterium]MCL4227752.1 DUF4157 domain-containing protein [Myxococcales bacterium]